MNQCTFLGKVANPVLTEDKTAKIEFDMVVDKYRKSRNGDKIRDRNYLPMVAWDTAATTLFQHCTPDDLLLVTATARCENNKVVFRVNEFKIMAACPDEG